MLYGLYLFSVKAIPPVLQVDLWWAVFSLTFSLTAVEQDQGTPVGGVTIIEGN